VFVGSLDGWNYFLYYFRPLWHHFQSITFKWFTHMRICKVPCNIRIILNINHISTNLRLIFSLDFHFMPILHCFTQLFGLYLHCHFWLDSYYFVLFYLFLQLFRLFLHVIIIMLTFSLIGKLFSHLLKILFHTFFHYLLCWKLAFLLDRHDWYLLFFFFFFIGFC
jgi:hypothetical protein